MKRVWKFFTISLIFICCGCSANYNLSISNDSFKENININTLNPSTQEQIEDIESDDQITPLFENNYSALINKNSFYKKNIINNGEYSNIILDYEYNENNFGNSNLLNNCFEKFIFEKEDNYYIHAYGKFYCYYDEDIIIKIHTDNEVVRTNSNSVDGKTYTWVINNQTVDKVDIEFEVKKGFPLKKVITYSAIILGSIFIISMSMFIILKKQEKNNEI